MSTNTSGTGLGALQLGVIVYIHLVGAVVAQAYVYYENCRKDPLVLRYVIGFLMLVELGEGVLASKGLYTVSITRYGDPSKLFTIPKVLSAVFILGGISNFLSQVIITHYVVKDRRRHPLILAAMGSSLLTAAGWVLTAGQLIRMTSWQEFMSGWKWLVVTSLVLHCVSVALLAPTLGSALRSRYEDFSIRSSHLTTTSYRMLMLFIQLGGFEICITLSTLILFLTLPDNVIWIAMFAILTGVSTNSWLLMLNTRDEQIFGTEIVKIAASALTGSGLSSTMRFTPKGSDRQESVMIPTTGGENTFQ